MLPPGVCVSVGVEIAKPLSSIRKMIGSFSRHDALIASQNSPEEVAPSPAQTSVASSSSLSSACASLPAWAQPTACRNCVPVAEEGETMFFSGNDQWVGIWRPPEAGSAPAPTACSNMSSGLTPIAKQTARSR